MLTADPVAFVTICPHCDAVLDLVEIEDVAAAWNEAAAWSYLAQREHERTAHGTARSV